jgi:hypothetical protein
MRTILVYKIVTVIIRVLDRGLSARGVRRPWKENNEVIHWDAQEPRKNCK